MKQSKNESVCVRANNKRKQPTSKTHKKESKRYSKARGERSSKARKRAREQNILCIMHKSESKKARKSETK